MDWLVAPMTVQLLGAVLVIGALLTTRPNPDGTFPIADFATLHGNLAAAFPEQAETARQRLTAA